MKNKITGSIIIILVFLIAFYGRGILDNQFNITESISSYVIRIIYAYSWWIIPIIIALFLKYGFRNIVKELKLDQPFTKGILWASIMVIPMYIGSILYGELSSDIGWIILIKSTLLAGLFEEIFFRGFLFRQLFSKLKWGFIPAATLNAIIFASGHIYQGSTFNETLGVLIVTLLGGAWYAWLLIEWKENIWLPIGLHVLMNLSWALFDISDTALGGLSANIFRAVTIALSILITIYFSKKTGGLKINRNNLLVNKS